MDLYVLDSNFRKIYAIDEYISAIWTERHAELGDLTLTVPLNDANKQLLVADAFIGCADSEEVMILDTQDIEGNVLKVTGPTLDTVFKTRWSIPVDNLAEPSTTLYNTPEQMIMNMVWQWCTTAGWTAAYGAGGAPLGGIAGYRQVLPYLTIPDLDPGHAPTGRETEIPWTRANVFDEISRVAKLDESVGWALYPINITPSAYELYFTAYRGRDLTSDQSTYPVVRFSPQLDSLADVRELRSHAKYCTVAYAISPDLDPVTLTTGAPMPYAGRAYAYPTAEFETGWDRRTVLVEVSGITADSVGDDFLTYQAVMDNHAKNALANNNFTKVVDGEVVPQNQYTYGVDYTLGDVVELQDPSGYIQKARITEYIRSSDKSGSKEYPTVSVIE